MKLSENPNILQCYCSFVESNQLWLVMQMMDLGSALRVMTRSKALGLGVGLNEEWVAYILGEALNGLSYLHSNGQIHRDVKSGNILVHSDGSIRVADFGVSGWTVARGLRQVINHIKYSIISYFILGSICYCNTLYKCLLIFLS